MTIKGIPSTYNKDLQESVEPVRFSSCLFSVNNIY